MSNQQSRPPTEIPAALAGKSVVLVGLMGAGKTCIGQRLARRLDMEFIDADAEIEAAADRTVSEIFAEFGEQAFRDVERRVIARLLSEKPRVIATGGGAFMDDETRANARHHGISVWLKADLEVLVQRVSRRNNRPLLQGGDKRRKLEELMTQRYPTYSEADITVDTGNEPPESTVQKVYDALSGFDPAAGSSAAAE